MSTSDEHRQVDSTKYVGASVRRKEDSRFVRGTGRFVDDINLTGSLHAQFVRSNIAAGRILTVDLDAVRATRGIIAAFTAEDLQLEDIVARLDRPVEEYATTRMPVLARSQVRFMGEPIAIVVGVNPYVVEDAIEMARVSYESTTPVIGDQQAMEPGSPLVHEEAPGNIFLDVSMFSTPGIDKVFAGAAHIITVRSKTGRQNALPLETRGVIANWDDRDHQVTVHTCTQVPHQVRTVMAACLGLPEQDVRVVVPDMGGGFGLKCVVGREEIAVAAASLRLRKPVKWIEDRKDALSASFLSREQRYDVRAAFDSKGRMIGLDADIICDMGAYSCYPFTAGIEPLMASAELPSVYRVPAYRVRGRAVATNKAPTAPYRGVSRPQYVMVMERLFEKAARVLGVDALELRRANLIVEFPYLGVNGITYDPGSYRASLDLCEQTVIDEGWHQLKDEAASEGRMLGIGYACFSERTGYGSDAFSKRKMAVVPGFDLSEARMDPTGRVTVTSGTINHGQSQETTLAQIVADKLGIPIEHVRIEQGDTNRIAYGWGSFASRSAVIGGAAVGASAGKLLDRLLTLAAALLHVDRARLSHAQGRIWSVDDPEISITFAQIAEVAYLQSHRLPDITDPGLTVSAAFDVMGDGTFSNATHAALVEVEASGKVRVLRYICVEDCGVAINPLVVEGQCRGGIAQGIAGALFEEVTYDELGQPSASSFIDYKVPTAMEIPDVLIKHLETPCLFNETGAKGAGEGGTIGAPATVLNAVNDALSATGVQLEDTPIRPEVVFAALMSRSGVPA
ncbi:MAG TPA: xanthine dehydrogenase [Chloroflexi bacterium]|nr:xanthine dehydrogenase [Chloroflexota bacterium]